MGVELYIDSGYLAAHALHGPAFDAAYARKIRIQAAVKRLRSRNGHEHIAEAIEVLEARVEKAQEEVEAACEKIFPEEWYYPDSYNATYLVGLYGFDWARIKDGRISPAEARKLAEDFEANDAEKDLDKVRRYLQEFRSSDRSEEIVREWSAYYAKKKVRLLMFLRHAAELGESIRVSA